MPTNPLPLAEFRERITRVYRQLEMSASTVQKFDQLLRELEESGVATTAEVTTEAVARWRADHCADRAPHTVAGQISVIRSAVSYAITEGYAERPPNWRLLKPKIPIDDDPRHLPWAEVVKLLTHLERRAGAPGEWWDRRLYALVSTIAYTGVRRDEGLFLRVQDLDPTRGVIWLRDIPERPLKTVGSGLPVPMPPELASILADWAPRVGDGEWLWPGVRGAKVWHGGGPGRRPIDALQAAAVAAEVTGEVTWQILRHSWATHAETLWGLSDAQIQRVLRHTKPSTSALYRHADLANLAKLGRKISFNPDRADDGAKRERKIGFHLGRKSPRSPFSFRKRRAS